MYLKVVRKLIRLILMKYFEFTFIDMNYRYIKTVMNDSSVVFVR